MKLGTIYEQVIKFGMQADPRGKALLGRKLSAVKKKYRGLKGDAKAEFDLERLRNPYADTRLLYGDEDKEIKTILVGIDIDAGELLFADKLRESGREIDLVISHHPGGYALAGLYEVMHMQTDLLTDLGVAPKVAEASMKRRIDEVERRLLSTNHNRVVDMARLLDIPYMCVHTASDNHVTTYLQNVVDKKKPKLLGDIIKILKQIPEYRDAVKGKAGPKILIGEPKTKAGKTVIEMTGGTEGTKELFGRLSQAGVQTLVGMHLSEEHFKIVKSEHLNVVIAGHISSDALGLNLLFDKLEAKEKFVFINCSGFRRVRR
ncbi:NGG1p interacting factor NIF3 [Candidatus Omnitrophota bacterium]